MAYATKGLWRDILGRRRPGVKQLGLAIYGLAAVAATFGFLGLGIVAWRSRLGGIVQKYFPPPFDTAAIVVLIALLTFPIWLRMVKKLFTLVRRMLRKPAVDPVDTVDTVPVGTPA